MLGGHGGVCHPTVKQISQDLGLSSESAVFEALAALEEQGFILRALRRMRGAGPRRNVYQRASCEYTVLTLLRRGRIDGGMRPAPGFVNEMSDDAKGLRDEWLREKLGAEFQRYAQAPDDEKAAILTGALEAIAGKRA